MPFCDGGDCRVANPWNKKIFPRGIGFVENTISRAVRASEEAAVDRGAPLKIRRLLEPADVLHVTAAMVN
jgi:hypothetical protein